MAKPNPLRAALMKGMKPAAPAPTRFDDAEGKKPNPNGLYNRDGFMDRVPGKANSFTKQPPPPKPAGQSWMPPADYAKMMAAKKKGK
jgi:hypothetical protein